MAKKPIDYDCSDLSLGDPLGLCQDFSPSYTVRPGFPDPAPLIREVEGIVGTLPANALELTLDKGIGLEDEDIPAIIEALGGSTENLDLTLLMAHGRLKDLLSYLPSRDPRTVYLEHVARCEALRGDEEAFREEGCKRGGHLMLPRGRMRFSEPGTYRPVDPARFEETEPYRKHPVGPATESRWKDQTAPLDARTQSPEAHAFAEARRGRVELLAANIEKGVRAYAKSIGATDQLYFPRDPAPLIAAGVDPVAARVLAGRGVALETPGPRLIDRIVNVFGGAALRIDYIDPTSGEKQGSFFDLSRINLLRMRGPMRAKEMQRWVATFKGPSRPRKKRKRAEFQRLPLRAIEVVYPKRAPKKIPLRGRSHVAKVLSDLSPAGPWTIVLTLGRPEDTRKVELQHSMLMGGTGRNTLPNYTELRGMALPELSLILARRLVAPRKRRRGRRQDPFTSAKKNPVATYTLPPGFKMEPGSWVPYTPGAIVVPGKPKESRGKVVYLSKKEGAQPRVTSAARVAAWMIAAQYGHDVSVKAKGKEGAKPEIPALRYPEFSPPQEATASNPSRRRKKPMARRKSKKKTRRNPRGSSHKSSAYYLSSQPELNKDSTWYYPGTVWDYSELGDYSHDSAVPVNRRNPAKKSKRKKVDRRGWSEGLHPRAVHSSSRAQLISALAKGKPLEQRKAIFAMPTEELRAMATNNPSHWRGRAGRYRGRGATAALPAYDYWTGGGVTSSPYWPEDSEYEMKWGPYGTNAGSTPLPPNRRNPRGPSVGRAMKALFPGTCAICNSPIVPGESIVQDLTQRGPKGGKVMVHASHR